MLITASQLVAHGVGDYLLQSHWMATEKTKKSFAAGCHALAYTAPFVFLTHSLLALGMIAGTHFLIDRFRLARFVVWAKNHLAPPNAWPPSEIGPTGYAENVPPWLAVWLLIIADNLLHILINAEVLSLFGD